MHISLRLVRRRSLLLEVLGLPLLHKHLLHWALSFLGRLLVLAPLLPLYPIRRCDLDGSLVFLSCAMVFDCSAFIRQRRDISDSSPSDAFPELVIVFLAQRSHKWQLRVACHEGKGNWRQPIIWYNRVS